MKPFDQTKGNKVSNENIHAGHRQRVYEAFEKDALLNTFSEVEALELLLFPMYSRINTNIIAHKLLNSFGSLMGVFSANVKALMKIEGISFRVANFLKTIPAIMRKAEITKVKMQQVKDLSTAIDVLLQHFKGIYSESLYVMNLDVRDRLLGIDCVSNLGTATSVDISMAAIVESVVRHKSTKIVIAHNHPAGVLKPSEDDLRATRLVAESLSALDAFVIDHIIFTPEGNLISMFNVGLITELYEEFDKIHRTSFGEMLRKQPRVEFKTGIEYVLDLLDFEPILKEEYVKRYADKSKFF